jgi:hypothetical protein
MRFLLFLPIFFISSCTLQRVAPHTLPALAVALPTTKAPRTEYAQSLYHALSKVLRQKGMRITSPAAAVYTLHTTITPTDMNDALTSEHGVSYATNIQLAVTAQLHDRQGKVVWEYSCQPRGVAHRPQDQAWYPHFFAHARDELCYDSALYIYNALLGFLCSNS